MEKVFFTNSGTEAIEGALKIARRYAYNKKQKGHGKPEGPEIIAMGHSFHGRSMGALSVTGNTPYQEPFKPLIPGIRFAEYNDLESVERAGYREYLCSYSGDDSGRGRNLSGRKRVFNRNPKSVR